METRKGTSSATVLLAIVLAAVPLMAIFGVPKLAPLTDGNVWQSLGNSPDENRQPLNETAAPKWDDEKKTPAAQSLAMAQQPLASRNNPFARPSVQSQQLGTPVQFTSDTTDVSRASSAQVISKPLQSAGNFNKVSRIPGSLTWQDAVQQLEQFGIQKYRLEPGVTSDQFLFVCFYSPQNDPRVILRFEAEAGNPLEAVEKVLIQINQSLSKT